MPPLLPRIHADFNGLSHSRRTPGRLAVPLDTEGSRQDLAAAGVEPREGVRLTVFDWSDEVEDLEAEATLYRDPGSGVWIAELDADGYRYVPRPPEGPAPSSVD